MATSSNSQTIAGLVAAVAGAAKAASVSFVLTTAPTPAARPRVGRWGTYYPKSYTTWRKEAEPQVTRGAEFYAKGTPLIVIVETIARRPRTSVREWPRGDVDNFAKGPLDIITKSAKRWEDDDQVIALLATKRFAESGEEPRSIVHIIPT